MQKKLDDRTIRNLKPPPSGRLEIWDKLLPGFGLRVTENDVRTYFVMYRTGFGEGRKQRRYRLGDAKIMTLGEAREAARTALNKVARGIDPAEDRVPVQGIQVAPDSFAAAAATYLDRYVRKNTRPPTYREAKRIFDVDLIPAWGARPIAMVTRRDIDTVLNGIVDRGAEVQANRVLARLRTFFNWAVDKEYVAASPVARMKPPTRERARDRALDDDEIRWFWQATGQLGWPFGPLFRLLLITAQRRDEISGMTWSELDLERRVWTIPRERAKNDRAHDVALSQLALEIIAELPMVDRVLVFTTNGKQPVSGFSRAKVRLDALMNRIRRDQLGGAAGAARIEGWILHDLRRTAATGMAGLVTGPHIVDKVLNHVSGAICGVAAVYNRHGYEKERAAALEAWAAYIARLIRPAPAGSKHRAAAQGRRLTKKSKHERRAASPSSALDAGLARADLLILRLKAADGKRWGPGAQGRSKIKKFWQPIGFAEIGQVGVDWGTLEAAGTVALGDEHRQSLVAAVNDYMGLIKLYQASPRASDMRRNLEELAAVFKAFRVGLSSGAPGRVAAIRHVVMTMAIRDEVYVGDEILKDVLRTSHWWENEVAKAMKDLPRDEGGTPGDPFIGFLLAKAYEIYLAAGGEPFTRRFADDATRSEPATAFLKQVCAVAGYRRSEPTIRDTLRRALRRKNPVNKSRG